jgi:hypothetical protein
MAQRLQTIDVWVMKILVDALFGSVLEYSSKLKNSQVQSASMSIRS